MVKLRMVVVVVLCVFECALAEVRDVCIGTYRTPEACFRQVSTTDEVWYIPLFFHLIEKDASQHVDYSVIRQIVDGLNADFNLAHATVDAIDEDFTAHAGIAHIRFYLPDVYVDNEALPGIRRVHTEKGPFGTTDVQYSAQGGSDAYCPDQYVNVWIADLASGIAGWSSTPEDGDDVVRGVVADYQQLREPYGYRTLTHELGHYFGLQHLEGGQGGCEDDDGIADTPVQSGTVSACAEAHYSCGSKDMVQNFMNPSEVSCMLFFTSGQIDVMRSVLLQYYADQIHEAPDVVVLGTADDPEVVSWQLIRQAGQWCVSGTSGIDTYSLVLLTLQGQEVWHRRGTAHATCIPTGMHGVHVLVAYTEQKRQSWLLSEMEE